MTVEWERRGPAAWVTFNRPDAHNAMTSDMYEQLFACCERADAEDDVRVLVLRGAGGKAFVAGTDIRQFLEFSSPEDGIEYERTIDRIVGRLERVRKPTIALVDGFAMGSGLALSAACDLRICTPAAVFGLPIARTVGNCLSMENHGRLDYVGCTYSSMMPITSSAAWLDWYWLWSRTVWPSRIVATGSATQVLMASTRCRSVG